MILRMQVTFFFRHFYRTENLLNLLILILQTYPQVYFFTRIYPDN